MNRPLRAAAFLVAFSALPSAAQTRLSLAEALALAARQSPELLSLAADVRAAQALLRGAGDLPFNPELEAAAGPRFGAVGTRLDAGAQLSQELEVAGQRGLRQEAARAALGAAEARLRARAVALAAEVREAFAAALAAERRVVLAQQSRALAEDVLAVARERHEAGKTGRLEPNAARAELGATVRALHLAQGRHAAALARLAGLLALPPDAPVAPAGSLEPSAAPVPDEDQAAAEARSARAEIVAAARAAEAALAEQRLEDAGRVPNVRVGVGVDREEDDTILRGVVSVPLPVFDRNRGARGAAAAREQQAREALRAEQQRVEREARTALARHAAARQALAAFDADALAALEENLGLANESYRAGKMDLLQLLVARREALEGRAALLDAREELAGAEAELDRALGRLPEAARVP